MGPSASPELLNALTEALSWSGQAARRKAGIPAQIYERSAEFDGSSSPLNRQRNESGLCNSFEGGLTMNKMFTTLGTLGLGAGVMYFYDPDRGRRRRALVRDKVTRTLNQSDEFIDKAAVDLRNRTRGTLAEAMAMLSDEEAPDWILEERVRAELGRVARHPRAIEVSANQGRVTLSGPILGDDVERVLSRVAAVRGVKGVDNQLEVHQQADEIPALQGNPPPREPRMEFAQQNWSPTARLLAGVGGGFLAVYGRARRGLIGTAMSLAGLSLLARGVSNMDLKRLFGGTGRRAVDVTKAININAPVEQVYEYWSHFENFPRFMTHVREIRDSGDGRSHWVVAGPAGAPVEFDAMITKQVPNQIIAWKSLPDQTVKSAGIVRFDPNPDGSMRVTVHMSYNPPAGVLGHAVASLFGVDPKKAMDDDLVRLKSLLEAGKTSADGKEVTRQELSGATGIS
jgi:uncharacterized membrane protein